MDFNEITNHWRSSFNQVKKLENDDIQVLLKIKKKSNTALGKIKKSYKKELVTGTIMYSIMIIGILWFIDFPMAILFLTLVSLLMGGGLFFAWKSYSKIKYTHFCDDSLRPMLIKTINCIERYVKFGKSNFVKYLTIPFSTITGVFIGLYIASQFTTHKNYLESFLSYELNTIIKIIVVIIMVSIATIIYSQILLKKMYQQHLDELKRCVTDIDGDN